MITTISTSRIRSSIGPKLLSPEARIAASQAEHSMIPLRARREHRESSGPRREERRTFTACSSD
jgi:hypothetical protein